MSPPGVRDFGYSNARVRAMNGELLSVDLYEQLIKAEDVAAALDVLEGTPYEPEIRQSVIRTGDTGVLDQAIKQNLVKTFQKILGFVDGEAKELIEILLGRWDLYNLKTIIRGKRWRLSQSEILNSLIPAGQFDDILLGDLARQGDVNLVIDLLATWDHPYARPLRRAYARYLKYQNLAILEVALDKAYYERAFDKTKKRTQNNQLVREILATSVDVTNIITLLRVQEIDFTTEAERILERSEDELKTDVAPEPSLDNKSPATRPSHWTRLKKILSFRRRIRRPEPPEKLEQVAREADQTVRRQRELSQMELDLKKPFFIPGSQIITERRFLELIDAGGILKLASQLETTPFSATVRKAMEAFTRSAKISTIERGLEEFLVRKAARMFRLNPLSMGVIIGFIWNKFNEVVNLRVILVGKTVGMPPSRIREELILL